MYHLLDSVAIRKIVSVTLFSVFYKIIVGLWNRLNLTKSVDLEKNRMYITWNNDNEKASSKPKNNDDGILFNQAKNVETLSSE